MPDYSNARIVALILVQTAAVLTSSMQRAILPAMVILVAACSAPPGQGPRSELATPSARDTIPAPGTQTQLAASSPRTALPPNQSPATDTDMPQTGATSLPTPIRAVPEIAIHTASADLAPGGPWMLLSTNTGLWIANEDGTALKLLAPEALLHLGFPPPNLSPDGARLAIVDWHTEVEETSPTLRILTLPDGTEEASIPLTQESLSEDDRFWVERSIELAWAPNGHRLAFVGALEGTTPDIYVYDVANSRVRRLTSGDSAVWNLSWSPNSEWIVQATGWQGTGAGDSVEEVWASRADGSGNKFLYIPPRHAPSYVEDEDMKEPSGNEEVVAWASNTEPLVVSWYPDFGTYGLRKVDLETGATMPIFDAYIDQAVVAQGYDVALVSVFDPNLDFRLPGLYLISLDGSSRRRLIPYDEMDWSPYELAWFPQLGRFLAEGVDNYLISPTGEIVPTGLSISTLPAYPPATDLWVRAGESGLVVGRGDESGGVVFGGEVFDVAWSPNSPFLVFFGQGKATDQSSLYISASPEFRPIPIASGFQIDPYLEEAIYWIVPW